MLILTPSQLKPGMIAMSDVKTPNGQVLAESGTELTRQLINRMKLYMVETVVVELPPEMEAPEGATQIGPVPTIIDEIIAEAEKEEPVTPLVPEEVEAPQPAPAPEPAPVLNMQQGSIHNLTPTQRMVQSEGFQSFQRDYYLLVEKIKEAHLALINDEQVILYDEILSNIQSLFRSAQSALQMFSQMGQLKSNDDPIYVHCLNVALYCRMLGRWLHLEPNDLNILTMCGVYHDIGKGLLPENLLNKSEILTSEEKALVSTHARLGYDLIHKTNLDSRIGKAALMHHERCDGSGYPSGYPEEVLDDFSQIVAIADVYDAMTSARSYRAPQCPFQVMYMFEMEGYHKFNTKFLLTFLGRIAVTYQNNRVLLSDNRIARIVMQNRQYLSRPMVQLDDGTILDLADSTNKDLFIKSIM